MSGSVDDGLLAVDWGTSSLRGALLERGGRVSQQREFARGVQTVADGDFQSVFDQCFGDWMAGGHRLCLMAGMVGSRQGWVEAPYCACPVGLDDIAAHLTWVDPGRTAARLGIVPGLCCEHPRGTSTSADVPDVMRGEETQILGVMRLTDLDTGCFVLPGTHSKWVWVEAGQVRHWRTFMSGEFFALLSRQSILAKTLPADDPGFDERAFVQGLEQARNGLGLLHNAFGVRTLSLFDRLAPAARAAYLSGLVIGEELRVQDWTAVKRSAVCVIGATGLTRAYALALAHYGVAARVFGVEAGWAGLWAIAERASSGP